MDPKFIPEVLRTELVTKYDHESMKKKFESLSDDNRTPIDYWTNFVGEFSFENTIDIILSVNEDQRKKISSILSDIRMATDKKVKGEAAQEFVKYLRAL